jgi:hypothetical protein
MRKPREETRTHPSWKDVVTESLGYNGGKVQALINSVQDIPMCF